VEQAQGLASSVQESPAFGNDPQRFSERRKAETIGHPYEGREKVTERFFQTDTSIAIGCGDRPQFK
jgi:hypothetical protein